jgi:hypothetical protein
LSVENIPDVGTDGRRPVILLESHELAYRPLDTVTSDSDKGRNVRPRPEGPGVHT